MRAVAVVQALLLAACASAPAPPPAQAADPGLLSALRATVPLNPIGVGEDPYATWAGRAPPVPPASSVCAVRFETDRTHYRLATFGSAAEAGELGYRVTHTGTCGACSTLQDLAVYLERPDLTAPVRRCGMQSGTLECLEALGFTHACAQIGTSTSRTPGGSASGFACAAGFPARLRRSRTACSTTASSATRTARDRCSRPWPAGRAATRAFAPPSNARTSRCHPWCTTTSRDHRRHATQGCRTRVVSRYFGPWRAPAVPANEQG